MPPLTQNKTPLPSFGNPNMGLSNSTPQKTTLDTAKPVVGLLGNLLPGVKAIGQAVQQKSFAPITSRLKTISNPPPIIVQNPQAQHGYSINREGAEFLANQTLGFFGEAESIKVAIDKLVETKSIPVIKQTLKDKFPTLVDGIIEEIAPKIAATSDRAVVSSLLDDAGLLSRATKGSPVGQLGQTAESRLGQVEGELQSTQEALQNLKRSSSQLEIPAVSSAPKVGDDAISIVTKALSEAKPIRSSQEALYTAERAKRVARVASVGAKVKGEQGFFAQLGQLKGELPKAEFEGIRSKVTQPVIDELFNTVESARITPFEKINAKTGLSKLLGAEGGRVPTKSELRLLHEIFPPEFMKAILDKRPLMQRIWGGFTNALNLPRAVMATFDLSAPLRQGLFLVGRPKQWGPAFVDMFKHFASEKAYQGLLQEIQSRPTYMLMRESHLALTDMTSNLSAREEAFMSNLAEKIPGFGAVSKASNRAYSGFLNKLRADVFDDLFKKAISLGVEKDNSKVFDDIARFVNSATGRGDIGALSKASEILNGLFFSPRLMASRLNLLNPAFYIGLDPFVRKEAIQSLLTLAGIGTTIITLANLGGLPVGSDPRSADFGKIKSGNTRFDIWGGFQQYIVAASRLITGQMVSSTSGREFNLGEGYKPTTRMDIIQRFFESKTSPVASFAISLLKGQTATGEKTNVPAEIADRFIPMVASDIFDLYKDRGAEGFGMALPAFFGTGVQTYSDQIPMESTTATGRPSTTWRQAPGLGETLLNKVTGKQVTTIPQEQQEFLQEKRKKDSIREADIDRAKKLVLQNGESQQVGDTYVYLDNGIVKTTTSEVTSQAVELDKELQTLSKEEANARVIELKTSNPQLYAKLKTVVENRKKDLNYEEKLMLQLGVTNGERTHYINEQILKLPTSVERNTYLKELQDKKIITNQVYEQLKQLPK